MLTHKCDNIATKLRDLHVPERESKEIMNSIFDYQAEDTLHLGLIDSSDANYFQLKLENLTSTWDKLHSGFMNGLLLMKPDCFAHHLFGLFAQLLVLDSHLHCRLGMPR